MQMNTNKKPPRWEWVLGECPGFNEAGFAVVRWDGKQWENETQDDINVIGWAILPDPSE